MVLSKTKQVALISQGQVVEVMERIYQHAQHHKYFLLIKDTHGKRAAYSSRKRTV